MLTIVRSHSLQVLASGLALCVILVVALAPVSASPIIIVNSVADPGDGVCDDRECTLREAIASAGPGDLITLALPYGARIRLQAGELVIDRNLTLAAPASTSRITVDGNSRGRVLRVEAGAVVEISGLRIAGGNSEFEPVEKPGGGIWNGGRLTLVHVLVDGNQAWSGPAEDMLGGGVYNQGVLVMQGSVLRRNYAFVGGGLANVGEALIQDSEISVNRADGAGGVSNNGSLVLLDSIITHNSADSAGAGIANQGDLLMRSSVVRANTTWGYIQGILGYGGGIHNQGTAQLIDSAVVENRVVGYGGGAYNEGTARLINSAVVGNSASISGAGIWNASEMVVTMSTIGRNTVSLDSSQRIGGGLGNGGHLTLSCSTVTENAPEGVNTFWGGHTIFGGSIIAGNIEQDCEQYFENSAWHSYGGNLLADGGNCLIEPGDRLIDSTQVFSTTLYPLPDSLPSDSAAIVYALRPESVAIDAGLNCVDAEGNLLTQDQRGAPRPIDGDSDGAFLPDAGSYEFNAHETPTPTATPTSTPTPRIGPYTLLSQPSADATVDSFWRVTDTTRDGSDIVFIARIPLSSDPQGRVLDGVYLYDVSTKMARLISAGLGGALPDGNSESATISNDGRFIAFSSSATNLVPGDVPRWSGIYLHDVQTETTTLISHSPDGVTASSHSVNPTLSDDGRYVAFYYRQGIYLYDRLAEETTHLIELAVDQSSVPVYLSGNGRYVAYETTGVFVLDRQSSEIRQIAADSNRPGDLTKAHFADFSSDGRSIVYYLDHFYDSNLHHGPGTELFLYDQTTMSRTRIAGVVHGGDSSHLPRLATVTDDSRFVAFASAEPELVEGDVNAVSDIFIFDRVTGRISGMPRPFENTVPDDRSELPMIAGDGHSLVFTSYARNLVSPTDVVVGSYRVLLTPPAIALWLPLLVR